jgi:putative MATE family efflux protein
MRRDLTTGSIPGELLRLSLPTVLAMVFQTTFSLVDGIFVARLGKSAIAAVTFVFPVMFLTFGIAMMIGVGATSLMARHLGGGRADEAENAANHAFAMALAFGMAVTLAGFVGQRPLYGLIGAEPEVLELAVPYSSWVFAGAIFVFLGQAAASVLRAEGEMVTPMKVMIAAVILNCILDPILIFGLGPAPALGVTGAAIATSISRAAGAVVLIAIVLRGGSSIRVHLSRFAPDLRVVREIVWVGLPASANHLIMSTSRMLLLRILASAGAGAVPAYGIAGRLMGIAIMPCLGIGTAVLTMVGQNVGAREYDRAERTTWTAAGMAMVVMEAIGIVFFLTPRHWMMLFLGKGSPENAAVIAHGVAFLRTTSLTYMFIGVSIVISSAFQGAGKGMPALVLTLLRLVVIAVPLAFILSRFMGVQGVWTAIAASSVLASVAAATWFRAGTWKGSREELPAPGS